MLLLTFTGCGPEIITVTSSNNPSVNNHPSSGFISSVIDKRGTDPFLIGNISGAVTGKKVRIMLNDSLSVYIKNFFNSSGKPVYVQSADVVVNSFSLTENFAHKDFYYLFGSLYLNYRDDEGKDSMVRINLNADISRDKNKLGKDIDVALASCLSQFATSCQIKNIQKKEFGKVEPDSLSKNIIRLPDSIQQVNGEEEIQSGNISISDFNSVDDTNYQDDSRMTNHIIYDEQVPVPEIHESNTLKGAGFTYFTGDKISGGVQFDYRLGYQKPDWEYGFSIGFMYLTIKNFPYEGYLWAINLPFHGKYMLSDSYFSPYIGGTLRLIGGQTDDSKGDDEKDTFWGPILEEYFGLSVDRSIFIEAGVFQMFLFNAPLLQDDAGFRLSFHFLVGQ